MAKRGIESRAQDLLTLARKLAETTGLTWVEANNAVYGPGGPFARLFPTAKDRVAFAKTEESRQIDQLIDSLPEPPVGPQRREYSGKFNVRVPPVAARRAGQRGGSGRRESQSARCGQTRSALASAVSCRHGQREEQLRPVGVVLACDPLPA